RGVWLDRGELDKIIERAGAYNPPPPPASDMGYDNDGPRDRRGKRKGGIGDLLGDIFDF
ncbi:MAG: zf-TFIIB domain-containing protein, partial [Pseudomonadota bacterium]